MNAFAAEDGWPDFALKDHPQGIAVARETLIHREPGTAVDIAQRSGIDTTRPLAGIRVLDLTRVIAGPAASRFLAGDGAQVLRIDPDDWNEPGLALEMNPGKCCARLDLKSREGRAQFEALLASADILLHGYRANALDRMGLDAGAP